MTKLSTRLDRLMRIYHSIQKPYFRLRASKLFGVTSRPLGLCCDGLWCCMSHLRWGRNYGVWVIACWELQWESAFTCIILVSFLIFILLGDQWYHTFSLVRRRSFIEFTMYFQGFDHMSHMLSLAPSLWASGRLRCLSPGQQKRAYSFAKADSHQPQYSLSSHP